jgi:hypothetical protein
LKDKPYNGIYYDTVVVTVATSRAKAVPTLREALGPRHRKEAAKISLLNHIALVFWSEAQGAYWYRLSDEPATIHAKRVDEGVRALVPKREPRARLVTNTSAYKRPVRRKR